MKTGIELIAEERQRQISEEGWTPEHDDDHQEFELAAAGATYALKAAGFPDAPHIIGDNIRFNNEVPLWPFSLEAWKPGEPIRDLVKAGALIAAEIDRLQRKQS